MALPLTYHPCRVLLAVMLAVTVGASGGCRPSWSDTDLHGLSDKDVVARLGIPDWNTTLQIHRGDRLLEYRGSLLRIAPSDPGVAAEVKECGWKRWFGTTVVWMTKSGSADWRVVDSLSWRGDVRF